MRQRRHTRIDERRNELANDGTMETTRTREQKQQRRGDDHEKRMRRDEEAAMRRGSSRRWTKQRGSMKLRSDEEETTMEKTDDEDTRDEENEDDQLLKRPQDPHKTVPPRKPQEIPPTPILNPNPLPLHKKTNPSRIQTLETNTVTLKHPMEP